MEDDRHSIYGKNIIQGLNAPHEKYLFIMAIAIIEFVVFVIAICMASKWKLTPNNQNTEYAIIK
jgi:hypothetical protein